MYDFLNQENMPHVGLDCGSFLNSFREQTKICLPKVTLKSEKSNFRSYVRWIKISTKAYLTWKFIFLDITRSNNHKPVDIIHNNPRCFLFSTGKQELLNVASKSEYYSTDCTNLK